MLSATDNRAMRATPGRPEAGSHHRARHQGRPMSRVLSIDKTEVGRRIVWRVKVVTPRGEVRVVFIDADAGRGG